MEHRPGIKQFEVGLQTATLTLQGAEEEHPHEDCAEAMRVTERGENTGGVAPYVLDLDNAERLWQVSVALTR